LTLRHLLLLLLLLLLLPLCPWCLLLVWLVPQGPHLVVHLADGLVALAVHVEDLQEGLVHPLVRSKARLQPSKSHITGQGQMQRGRKCSA
jgi:hypothetical protein